MKYLLAILRVGLFTALGIAVAVGIHAALSHDWTFASPVLLLPLAAAALVSSMAAFLAPVSRIGAPSVLIPPHFQTALDALYESIFILDLKGTILYCNQQFLSDHKLNAGDLTGKRAKDLGWLWLDLETTGGLDEKTNWIDAVREGKPRSGSLSGSGIDSQRFYELRAVPILKSNQQPMGAMICLQDVTRLLKKQSEKASMLETIRQSSQQLRQLNSDLEHLAVRDALTGCLNRREGVRQLERIYADAVRDMVEFTCLLVDIDRFHELNQQFGHELADQILRETSNCLMHHLRPDHLLCRYEGEAFLIVLPKTGLEEGLGIAETLRHEVAKLRFDDVKITTSVGISTYEGKEESIFSLLSLTQKRLEAAKKQGRNQICHQDETLIEGEVPESQVHGDTSRSIPFPAVTALTSALAYRDLATALHSRRVADLCVAVGQRQMSMSGCYVLEMAALLHDIGKIGVRDETLLKTSPLSASDWSLLQDRNRIGVEIVRTAFATPELTEIVANYTRSFEEATREGLILPFGARILAVADAYDSMTSQQVYREPLSSEDACEELKRCAGTQFDPEIVRQFVEVISQRSREDSPEFHVNVETALAFGIELERFAEAVDQQNLDSLRTIASYLCRKATENGAHQITAKARELEQAAANGSDLLGVLQLASELLNYCRVTQRTYAFPGRLNSTENAVVCET